VIRPNHLFGIGSFLLIKIRVRVRLEKIMGEYEIQRIKKGKTCYLLVFMLKRDLGEGVG